ncbi:MAG: DUF4432 family protein [Opitutaceae bacterium]|nr:DUF4432 family protein [Opitutaceae bacterium]
MPTHTTVLLDVSAGIQADPLEITPATVGGPAKGYRVSLQRLRGGISEGVDRIQVDNGTMAFSLIPTRGMGLWKAQRGDLSLGWNSPVRGPVHPRHVPLAESSGLGWLDGFDELLVRCGLESNGAPDFDAATGRLRYPLHGRIGNQPAHRVTVAIDGATGQITVTGVVDEVRFHFLKLRMTTRVTTRVGQPGLEIRDEIENLSANPAEMQLLYHINFGAPLLGAGSLFMAPLETVVPRNPHAAAGIDGWASYTAPQTGYEEQVYFLKLRGGSNGRTRTLLRNAPGTRGASLTFDLRQMPCFTLWKNTTALADGYVTGLEPGTNYPNQRSYEGQHGRVVKLAGGAKTTFDLGLEAHVTAGEVEAAEREVSLLQGTGKPQIFRAPQPGWTTDAGGLT